MLKMFMCFSHALAWGQELSLPIARSTGKNKVLGVDVLDPKAQMSTT